MLFNIIFPIKGEKKNHEKKNAFFNTAYEMFSQNVSSASAVIRKENISQHLALIQYLTAIPANWSAVYSLEWRSVIFLLTGFIYLQGGKVE